MKNLTFSKVLVATLATFVLITGVFAAGAYVAQAESQGASHANEKSAHFRLPPGIAKKLWSILPHGIAKKLGATTTPSVDNIAPVISNIDEDVDDNEADISWDTNEKATSKIVFGTASPVVEGGAGVDIESSGSLTKDHSLELEGLASSTTYFYFVVSADAAGNVATSGEHSFTTGVDDGDDDDDDGDDDDDDDDDDDTTAPRPRFVNAFNVSTSSARIFWFTAEDGDSIVNFSTSSPVDNSDPSAGSTTTLSNLHNVMLTGLAADTTYYYVVSSTDDEGNTGTSSERSFTTDEIVVADDDDPVITSVSATSSASTSAEIMWDTNEPADSTVWYSTVSPVVLGAPSLMEASTTLATDHSIELDGLSASTTYFYTVVSEDEAGNSAEVSGNSFTTLSL